MNINANQSTYTELDNKQWPSMQFNKTIWNPIDIYETSIQTTANTFNSIHIYEHRLHQITIYQHQLILMQTNANNKTQLNKTNLTSTKFNQHRMQLN